jgi:hypothetical protein
MSTEPGDDGVVRAWGGGLAPLLLGAVAAVYFVAVWSEAAIASGVSVRWLSAPLGYFTQIAALFPSPTQHAIDYRVEGYRCRDKTWVELDVSPYFPIDAGNKENRFYRAIHFYGDQHPHRPTLRALDEFIVAHVDADATDAAAQGRGGNPIGGVRFSRLRTSFGRPGDGSPRYEQRPLSTYPAAERADLYYTPESKRQERCARIDR